MSTSLHGCIHQQLSNARKLCQIYSAFGPITIRLKHRPTPLRTTRNIWISCSDHMLKCRWLNRGWRQRLLSLLTVQSCGSSISFDCCSAQLSVTAAVQTFLHTWSALARSMAKPALSHTLAKHGTATFQNLKDCLNSQHHFNCIAIGILQDLSFKRIRFPKYPFSPLSKDYDLCRVHCKKYP